MLRSRLSISQLTNKTNSIRLIWTKIYLLRSLKQPLTNTIRFHIETTKMGPKMDRASRWDKSEGRKKVWLWRPHKVHTTWNRPTTSICYCKIGFHNSMTVPLTPRSQLSLPFARKIAQFSLNISWPIKAENVWVKTMENQSRASRPSEAWIAGPKKARSKLATPLPMEAKWLSFQTKTQLRQPPEKVRSTSTSNRSKKQWRYKMLSSSRKVIGLRRKTW